VRERTYTQTETFKASAYYHEFVRPQGWASLVVAGLAHTPDSFALLALTRSPRAVWLEPAERDLLEAVAPHLARAARVHMLLARSRATANALSAATGFAVFLLSATYRVLFANREAEELVRAQAGLRYERGHLAAVKPALTHRLEALACAGSSPRLAKGDIGGTLELPRGEDRLPLLAHVSRLLPAAPRRSSTSAGRRLPSLSPIPKRALLRALTALPRNSG